PPADKGVSGAVQKGGAERGNRVHHRVGLTTTRDETRIAQNGGVLARGGRRDAHAAGQLGRRAAGTDGGECGSPRTAEQRGERATARVRQRRYDRLAFGRVDQDRRQRRIEQADRVAPTEVRRHEQ